VSFWARSNDSNIESRRSPSGKGSTITATRLIIIPNDAGMSRLRVVVDLAPRLDPTATITYQAMIPNNSAVFRIARSGEVTDLIELFEKGTASLTDRDEQGGSLLSVSLCNLIVERPNTEVVCSSGFECRYMRFSCGQGGGC
jgi:hypothetical protein